MVPAGTTRAATIRFIVHWLVLVTIAWPLGVLVSLLEIRQKL
jgi:hypothetical protein